LPDKSTIYSRLRATSIHFSLSALAFFIILYFILVHWYPNPHFTVNGGWQGVRIMLFVDIVLGPFLTLIIFNPLKTKKAIIFDLSIIAAIQISAFTWGVYAVHSQRPVGLTLNTLTRTIYPILEEELTIQEKTVADLLHISNKGKPPVFFAREAITGEEQAGAFTYEFIEGVPEYKLLFLLDPISEHIDEIFDVSLEKSKFPTKKFTKIRQEYIEENNFKSDDIAFVPFEGRYGYSLLIFNRSGEITDAIPDPRHSDTF